MTQKRSIFRKVKSYMLNHIHGMITCKKFEDFVQSHLDGELMDRQHSLFE
jgi:hypothetical protein